MTKEDVLVGLVALVISILGAVAFFTAISQPGL